MIRDRDLNVFKKGDEMDVKVWMYLIYLAVSIGLTVWVARALSRNGLVFLEEVFADRRLADAVNSLLVVGFYLLNLGYVTVAMKHADPVSTTSQALEELSMKVGWVLLVLGLLHFFNVFALGRYRRNRLRQLAPHPPIAPVGHLPMQPGARPAGPGMPGPATGGPPPTGPAPAGR
ncbi:hypothetical protein U2F26_06610 [Micromonospora sp. 4G57]|uniref:Integral membrane protein n=1 Tax=Micromonospora sicca TaxID=2202420 RepID=A0ABU5JH45_9ACTN|nr:MULTISPECIES: hypothetical protein [unclassified Micromonospora]MDZ5442403.1 hypothetical protein [Micromonospora sp. 4G57]MDZ5491807.1 hypothetical protein [Micromonospora sp. 4G53]